jgi:hypothetical protein
MRVAVAVPVKPLVKGPLQVPLRGGTATMRLVPLFAHAPPVRLDVPESAFAAPGRLGSGIAMTESTCPRKDAVFNVRVLPATVPLTIRSSRFASKQADPCMWMMPESALPLCEIAPSASIATPAGNDGGNRAISQLPETMVKGGFEFTALLPYCRNRHSPEEPGNNKWQQPLNPNRNAFRPPVR